MVLEVNPRNIKIGDIVYFFGCGDNCYTESLYWVEVRSIYLVSPSEDTRPKINGCYNLAGCFLSAKEAIDHKRQWLERLEQNPKKLIVKAI